MRERHFCIADLQSEKGKLEAELKEAQELLDGAQAETQSLQKSAEDAEKLQKEIDNLRSSLKDWIAETKQVKVYTTPASLW